MTWREIINLTTYCSISLQPSQLLLCIVNFREAGIGSIQEGREFLAVIYIFGSSGPILKFLGYSKFIFLRSALNLGSDRRLS
jgi:hypothetical protein